MDLTPIRIPGQYKLDGSKEARKARKALNRPKGSPFKLPPRIPKQQISDAITKLKKTIKKRSLKNIKSRRKMSSLEKLPTELLERVFFYCLNLDLPRSSPVIGGKLSSESVYTRTIHAAFDETWKSWYGINFRLTVNQGFPQVNPNLQSSILCCRWATISTMLKSREVWVEKYAPDRIFKPIKFFRSDTSETQNSEDEAEDDNSTKTVTDLFDQDFADFSSLLEQQIESWTVQHYCWDTYVDVAEGVEIPSSLLLGPWTEDMVKHLYWLVKGSAKIDWITSTSGEVALSGLNNAISTGDRRAIHLLVWAGLRERLDIDILIWALRNAGGDKYAVIKQLLAFLSSRTSGFSHRETNKLFRELAEIRGEAEKERSSEKLAFVKDVEKNAVLQALIQNHRREDHVASSKS